MEFLSPHGGYVELLLENKIGHFVWLFLNVPGEKFPFSVIL